MRSVWCLDSWLDCFWEEYCRSKVPFSSHYIKSIHSQLDLSVLMLTLITWLQVAFFRFLHCKVTFFLHFCTVLFVRKLLCIAHTYGIVLYYPKGGSSTEISWDFSAKEICPFHLFYVFIQSLFIFIWKYTFSILKL
jgi:hypothetical protein